MVGRQARGVPGLASERAAAHHGASTGDKTAMYRLYGKPFTMSMVPEGAMDELGIAYESIMLPPGPVTDPAYLALRPDGLVPTLTDGGLVIYEGSAIAMWLAERHGGLAPAPGTPERARWLQWMVWLGSMVHPQVALEFHADWFTDDPAAIPAIQARARRAADELWAQIEGQLGDDPWLCGEAFTTADILFLIQALFHWDARAMFARSPRVSALAGRIQARPAMAALLKKHGVDPAPVP